MAEKLLNKYKTGLKEVALVPSQGGAFEVVVDGEKLYSKNETGTFPSERVILDMMDTKV